ncbi:MAG: hypothetical protein ACI9AT_000525 [Ulvibacter sp.]|jgi:hypothetical protein
MKKSFQNRIGAINWIANFVDNEGQFEVLREQLTFNYIYSKSYFLNLVKKENLAEVILLRQK